jgi:serine/threonine-protein kinase SRPK3
MAVSGTKPLSSAKAFNKYVDITPSNILHRIAELDGKAKDHVLQILGELKRNLVRGFSPLAPRYLIYPVKWFAVEVEYISEEPCLIDFGELFKSSYPPKNLGTPGLYRSPELRAPPGPWLYAVRNSHR